MCLDDGSETHQCINVCPVCYILTPENVLQLLLGTSIQLGQIDLFVQIARLGCRMCQVLCNMWQLNGELFQPGIQVNVKRDKDTPTGLLWALLFEISEPFGDRLSEGTGWYRIEKFKSWAVPFGIYSKGSESLDHFITMRPSSPSVNHDEVFFTFRASLETCLSGHKECKKPDVAQLPTRVLLLDDKVPERIMLHKCEPGDQGSYVALSYCWGTTAQTKLLQSNIDDFSVNGIEIRSLPKTIEDGIIATHNLGIRYLWVDSLCIIQDSAEDKDKEIASMANIYQNATVTISAAAATDCGQGFLGHRQDVQICHERSMCLPFLSEADEKTRTVIDWIYLCPDPHMGHKIKRFSEETINTRAWTYQESTLAPRLLIFGSGPPQWHCAEMWKIYGLDIDPKCLPERECFSSTMKITIKDGEIVPEETIRYFEREEPPKDYIGMWLTWFPLLENYSRRALSYRTDKLLALSALAAEHQSSQNGTYAAGLWEVSLPRGLLWRSSNRKISTPSQEQQTMLHINWLRTRLFSASPSMISPDLSVWSSSYVAPTWSPMSSTHPICFERTATQEENEFHTSFVEINEIHTEPTTSLNPFGQLNFGYLDLTGPMCAISWKELTANFVIVEEGQPFQYWDWIILDDPAFYNAMCEKCEPSFNPQTLADRSMQDPIDEGNCSFRISGAETRIRMPIIQDTVSHECVNAEPPFTSVQDVKHTVLNLLIEEISTSSPDSARDHTDNKIDDCEFWLLEVERSMSPAGLVLKQVQDDIFARVGYFAMNSSLDPETVCLPGPLQVRGRKNWNWGGPKSKSTWNDVLRRRKISLV